MNDEWFMGEALKEAKKAVQKGEWPVGCVVVLDGAIVSRAHNKSELSGHKIEHAETLAFRAIDGLLRKHPHEAIVYTTLEPCPMCVGASMVYKIKRIVTGANPEKSGGFCILPHLPSYYKQPKFAVETVTGVLEKECEEIFLKFHPKKLAAREVAL